MAIDEFGREIPGARESSLHSGSDSPHHNPHGPDDHHLDDNDYHRRHSSSRYDGRDRSNTYDDDDKHMSSGSGGHGYDDRLIRRSRSRSADFGGRSRSPSHRYGGGGGGNHRGRRSPSPPIGRRSRSASRGNSRSYSDDWGAGGRRNAGFARGGDRSHRRRPRLPVEDYVDDPMLCEFLWNEIHNKKNIEDEAIRDGHGHGHEHDEKRDGDDKMDDNNDINDDGPLRPGEVNAVADADMGAGKPNATDTDDNDKESNQMETTSTENDADKETDQMKDIETTNEDNTYEQYKKDYCLDYIRSFFNNHLDDEWFKQRYSPFHRKTFAEQMRNRATAEANAIHEEISKAADENSSSGAELFIREARLGIGKKPTGSDANKKNHRLGKKRSYSTATDGGEHMDAHGNNMEGSTEKDVLFRNPVPSSHILSGHTHCALEITEVPPYVTDAQLSHAVAEHSSSPPLRICSTTVGLGGSSEALGVGRASQKHCNSLLRTVWAIFINEEAKEEMVENLTKANFDANRISDRNRSMDVDIIPSIDAAKSNKILELDIDCSDAFGRAEIDADGHGGAPQPIPSEPDDMDRANPTSSKDRASNIPKVPLRKATVFVKTDSQPDRQNISVLSAAVSSKDRIPRDKTAALMIARALDTANGIPSGVQLDDMVEILLPGGVHEKEDTEEDVLDVAIAYLRRVHLFSFYNCLSSRCEGDVLSGFYPAGTIHLRLRDADTILQKAKEEGLGRNSQQESTENNVEGGTATDEKPSVATDLLVQRLDDSIAKALEESTTKIGSANILVNEKIDAEAIQIEKEEVDFKQKWLDDHALLDADGRARCSLHFCRKLFKDKTFLFKHLMKKHPEYLAGEQAKIHDSYMMQAWEEEEIRPIPQILIDCGDRFGLIPATVSGISPNSIDPFPELLKKDEEKRARREKEERERRERFQRSQQSHYDGGPYAPNRGNDVKTHSSMGGNSGGFVDVDDMQDEKVELSFENVALPLPPPKKKKKKKKIL